MCLGLLVCPSAFAQKNTQKNSEKDRVHRLNAATASEGEKVRGPRTIKPVFVNRIRYRVSVKTETAFTAGPSLALPFIPQIPGGGGGTGGGQDATKLANKAKELADKLDRARSKPDPEEVFETVREALGDLILRSTDIQDEVATLLSERRLGAAFRGAGLTDRRSISVAALTGGAHL